MRNISKKKSVRLDSVITKHKHKEGWVRYSVVIRMVKHRKSLLRREGNVLSFVIYFPDTKAQNKDTEEFRLT